MHAPIPAAFSLFFLPLSFFLFVLFLFLISNYYLAVSFFSHLGLFPFGSPSFGAYYSLTMSFFPQVPTLPWVPFFQCFSLFPCFPPIPSLVLPWLPSILQPTDSMRFLLFTPKASPIVFSLLWAYLQDYPPTYWLPRPLPLFSTCLLHRYSFYDKIPFCLFLLYTSTSLPTSMACIRWS